MPANKPDKLPAVNNYLMTALAIDIERLRCACPGCTQTSEYPATGIAPGVKLCWHLRCTACGMDSDHWVMG